MIAPRWVSTLTQPIALDDGQLILGAPDQFAAEWNESKHSGLLARVAERVLGRPTTVVFRVQEDRQRRPQMDFFVAPREAGDASLQKLGYTHGLQIAQCGGGTVPVERAGEAPLLTLDSGPVSGVTASMFLGAAMGEKNVITTDMGGTSFDVSLIHEGTPAYAFVANTDQYEYFLPRVDLQAIGAGGGSLVRVRPETRTMTVGPDSAGAFPGPVCYGRGGQVPTVTDAQLVLGYLDPDNFAGGRMKLDKDAASNAIEQVASSIGLKPLECAAGICRIVELQMADVIRKVTVEKGYDPRDFVLFAFGGAGPAHAGVFARELGVRKIVIPQRKAASTWCAFGAAAADVLHIFEHTEIMPTPVAASRINAILDSLESSARAMMKSEGIAASRARSRGRGASM